MHSLLSALAAASVVERAPGRHGSHLRVSPRFLAFAEGTAGRLRLQGRGSGPEQTLEVALQAWDEFAGDARRAAMLLAGMLADGHQLGLVQPVFPSLDAYAVAA